ncbi:glycosyltransferase family 2 protein [Aeromonas sp. QDB05]|uniref:glycosyltransferase family 2 protein n=1 Tax=Aeromonas sp. QDB05 TaxID=2990478 RepID=UPI0022E72290|nr:glycosyltransferase family 2 protein [Aeromonas sp. QDB05]
MIKETFDFYNSTILDAPEQCDVQVNPARVHISDDGEHYIKVDQAIHDGTRAIIIGWCSQENAIFHISGKAGITELQRHERPDVADSLKLAAGVQYGFSIQLDLQKSKGVICIGVAPLLGAVPAELFSINFEKHASAKLDEVAIQFGMVQQFNGIHPSHPVFPKLIAKAPRAQGPCLFAKAHFEAVVACRNNSEGCVVGWFAIAKNVPTWLEDETGNIYSTENAFRYVRVDVRQAISQQVDYPVINSGFICHVSGINPGQQLSLKVLGEDGVHVLATLVCSSLSNNPVEAAQWLASIHTPLATLHERYAKVDSPLLSRLLSHAQAQWPALPVYVRELGSPVIMPKVSIIVPLYGRTDFIEHQLMEFSEDSWFSRHVELIYVLDDPELVEGFPSQAEKLHRIYNIPFKWVWGSVNRGFSGANNLGASQASGEYLLFLNSDAFPREAGWVESLMMTLQSQPELGAITPRLLFADGGIQHAGMIFLRREELGIWVNHHPYMGLDPALDPHQTLATVPAVTGACMMLRRRDFDAVGGWDTGYLIGDFEDSDLCLKLRAAGFTIGYLPTVELTHLERQSFKLLGEGDFRTKVVILNATRHQARWHALLTESKKTHKLSKKLVKAI